MSSATRISRSVGETGDCKMSNSEANAFYHSKLGVRSYDLFNEDVDVKGPV